MTENIVISKLEKNVLVKIIQTHQESNYEKRKYVNNFTIHEQAIITRMKTDNTYDSKMTQVLSRYGGVV